MKRTLFILLVPVLFFVQPSYAQDGNQQVSYANLALQFSKQDFNGDAATGLFPSVATNNGFGSYIDNPASVALIEDSYFSFGLVNDQGEYESTYLNNSILAEQTNNSIGDLGFIYKLPTQQGSFVFGGGYNRVMNQNALLRINARNQESTITDVFREPDSDYNEIAFNAYAIDWGDVDSTYYESIFRIGFDEYPGITQKADISYSTNIGEYSVFFGTEFQKDLFVGISAGLTAGNYSYRRDFLEVDDQGDYNYSFIPSAQFEDSTDIAQILVHDEIDADLFGFSLRGGLIYQVLPKLRIGLSYLMPSTLVVREGYMSSIDTEFDDGTSPSDLYDTSFASEEDYEYRIRKPAQLNLGVSLTELSNFEISVSGELINYAGIEINLVPQPNDLDFDEVVALREDQEVIEEYISNNYNRVINLKSAVKYTFNELLEVSAGYAFLPGKSKIFEADKNIFSAGFSTEVARGVLLDINGQYSVWQNRSEIYNYYDYEAGEAKAENLFQDVSNLKILAGIRILF